MVEVLIKGDGLYLKGSIKLFYYNKVATSITHNSFSMIALNMSKWVDILPMKS